MTGPTQKTRALVLARDGGCCVRCGREVYNPDTDQLYGMYSLQHRSARGMGGTRNPAVNGLVNLVTLCGSGTTDCHGHVETHRDEARMYGWAVSRHQDPAVVPMLHAYRGWVTVGDQYTALPVQKVWALVKEWMSQDPTRTVADARRVFRLSSDAVEGALSPNILPSTASPDGQERTSHDD